MSAKRIVSVKIMSFDINMQIIIKEFDIKELIVFIQKNMTNVQLFDEFSNEKNGEIYMFSLLLSILFG